MIRVLHLITGLGVGGAEASLFRLACGIDPAKFQFHIVSLGAIGPYGEKLLDRGFPVTALGARHYRDLPRLVQRLSTVVKEANPDWIHGWMYHGNLAATLAQRFARSNSRCAWNVRTSCESYAKRKALSRLVVRTNRRLSGKPDCIVYNASASRQQHEAFGFYPARGRVIPNGFDCDKFRPDADARLKLRNELGVSATRVLVGMVARNHPDKGHRLLFEALAKINNPEVQVVLVGSGTELGDSSMDQLLASTNTPTHRIIRLGPRTDLEAVYPAFDLLVSASRTEGFPNVVGEAMACGVPAVVTDVGDSAHVVADTGIVVDRENPSALADGITAMIERMNTAEAITRLSQRAREQVVNHFTLNSMITAYQHLYTGIES